MTFPDRYYKDGGAGSGAQRPGSGHFVIGGSDLGTILGVNPYETPTQLWERMRGLVPAKEETDAMKLGKVLEPWLRWQWEKRHPPYWLAQCSDQWTPRQEDLSWIRFSPDGAIHRGDEERVGIWEGKTTRSWAEWGPFGSDQIPERHLCQVQLYMHCTQLPEAWVSCALVRSNVSGEITELTYGEWRVPYDRELCESMLVKAKAFVDLVEAGIRPVPETEEEMVAAWKESQ